MSIIPCPSPPRTPICECSSALGGHKQSQIYTPHSCSSRFSSFSVLMSKCFTRVGNWTIPVCSLGAAAGTGEGICRDLLLQRSRLLSGSSCPPTSIPTPTADCNSLRGQPRWNELCFPMNHAQKCMWEREDYFCSCHGSGRVTPAPPTVLQHSPGCVLGRQSRAWGGLPALR